MPPKGPIRTQCPAGHEYSVDNTYVNPRTGNRQCRACQVVRGRRTFRSKLYGLSLEEYTTILERQNRRCAICRQPAGELSLAADHDHATGAIRGLLCSRCNNGLGSFHDDPTLLQAAAAYLMGSLIGFASARLPLVGRGAHRGTNDPAALVNPNHLIRHDVVKLLTVTARPFDDQPIHASVAREPECQRQIAL